MNSLPKILEEIIRPEKGDFSPELARYIASLRFSAKQQARYTKLADKCNEGMLTPEETAELDAFVFANTFLSIVKSKAKRALRQRPRQRRSAA